MRRITIKCAATWHYRKMRPRIEPSNDLALSSPFRSWLDCITNTSGYDFRKGQDMDRQAKPAGSVENDPKETLASVSCLSLARSGLLSVGFEDQNARPHLSGRPAARAHARPKPPPQAAWSRGFARRRRSVLPPASAESLRTKRSRRRTVRARARRYAPFPELHLRPYREWKSARPLRR